MYRKISLLVMGALAVLGSLVVVSGAQAAETGPDTADCALQGTATVAPTIPLSGPKAGTYSFTSFTGDCVVTGPDDASDVVPVSISSSGSYNQPASPGKCGFGSATSTAGATTVSDTRVPPSPEFPAKIDYGIVFNAGAGVLTVTGGSHGDGTGASGTGAVQITPVPPSPPNTTDCAVGFNVVGSAQISLTD